jgi:hypothetical protein
MQASVTRRPDSMKLRVLDNQENERIRETLNNPEQTAYVKQQDLRMKQVVN